MRTLAVMLVLSVLFLSAFAAAHAERHVDSPPREGAVPDPDRAPTEVLDVCKTGECAFEDIQAAVNAAHDGALIRVWPGLYEELPSRAAPDLGAACDPWGACNSTFSFDDQLRFPNSANLIAILGKHDITVRGMGDDPSDVVIDVGFAKHVGLRADRADGIVLQNFQVWHAVEHGVYALDLSGALFDRVGGLYSGSYELFFFAMDHGLMLNCEAVGGGDSGIYIGGAPSAGRVTSEVRGCHIHHNVLGFSGTNGNDVWLHDSVWDDNAAGIVLDSETDHPNYPQRAATIEHNLIKDNNLNVYDGVCDEDGCSDIRPEELEGITIPVGVGVFLPSNNLNTISHNTFQNNHRAASWLSSGQGIVAGPLLDDPQAAPFVSKGNRYLGNVLDGNGVDFMWDGLGVDNCWQGNVRTDGAEPTTDGAVLPPCSVIGNQELPFVASAPNPADDAALASLVIVDGPDGTHPACHYMGGAFPCVGGEFDPATTWPAKATALNSPPMTDAKRPPTPPTCGPSDDASCWS